MIQASRATSVVPRASVGQFYWLVISISTIHDHSAALLFNLPRQLVPSSGPNYTWEHCRKLQHWIMRNGYGSQRILGEDTPNRNFIHLESLQINGVPGDGGNENAPLLPPRRWYKRLFSSLFGTFDDHYDATYNVFGFRRNLDTLAGVFAPVALGQFANNLFLRTGKYIARICRTATPLIYTSHPSSLNRKSNCHCALYWNVNQLFTIVVYIIMDMS